MQEILETFGINWKLLVIQIINFGLLLAILHRYLYKPVLAILEERRAKIEKGIRDADAVEEKLAHLKKEESVILAKAHGEGDRIIEESRRTGAEKEHGIVSEAEERGRRIIAESERRAEEEKERILAESRGELARIAVLSAEKILREKSA
ncbi:F0F1 ATP synthase subunit B [bacterium]|nr:F0F1 ATP synthase subunit B [bacterium]